AVIPGTAVGMAGHALLAALARQDPPARHPCARREIAFGIRSELNELTPKIAAENVRELSPVRLVAPRTRHQVLAVEAHGVHLDQGFTALRARSRKIGELENVGVAVLLENDSLHVDPSTCASVPRGRCDALSSCGDLYTKTASVQYGPRPIIKQTDMGRYTWAATDVPFLCSLRSAHPSSSPMRMPPTRSRS